jgi:hypothetical protein
VEVTYKHVAASTGMLTGVTGYVPPEFSQEWFSCITDIQRLRKCQLCSVMNVDTVYKNLTHLFIRSAEISLIISMHNINTCHLFGFTLCIKEQQALVKISPGQNFDRIIFNLLKFLFGHRRQLSACSPGMALKSLIPGPIKC